MNILDEVTGEQPVDLDELMGDSGEEAVRYPEAAERNRASSTALLSSEPLEVYQRIMTEGEEGLTYTLEEEKRKRQLQNKEADTQAIMSVLGDPEATDEAKQIAIESINSDWYNDTRNRIKQSGLIEADEGITGEETPEHEAMRVGLASQLRETFEYEEYLQGLQNRNEIFKDEITIGKVAGFFAYLLPFAPNANASRAITEMAREVQENPSRLKAFLLPGSFTQSVAETLQNIPPERRQEVAERFIASIEDKGGVFFGSDNHFNQWLMAKTLLESGGYTGVDAFLDNITGLFDAVGLGILLRGTRQGAIIAKEVERITSRLTTSDGAGVKSVPVAPANVVAKVNNEKGRQLFDLVVRSEGDEVSEALYGVSREEAVSSVVMPKPANLEIDPNSPIQLIDPTRNSRVIRPDSEVVDTVYDNGFYFLPPGEKEAARAHIVNDFYNGTGLHLHDNMVQVGTLEGGTVRGLRGVFSTPEGGFSSAEEAMDQAKHAFREYGVGDENITLLRRQDDEYVPVELEDVRGVPGDYAVRVETQKTITPADIEKYDDFDVRYNLFSRIRQGFGGAFGPKQGSLTRWLVDPSSMFRPEVSTGAISGFDRAVRIEKTLLDTFDRYAQQVKGLRKDQREMLLDHIEEANMRGLELTDADLIAQGFDGKAIQALKTWRQGWDNVFWLENSDAVRGLRSGGYQLFENGNARLYARPVGKNTDIRQAYDPATDRVVSLSRRELDDLYEKGGTTARLRNHVHIDDDIVEHMIVRNTPDEYLRAFTEADQVLNYRKGYYRRQYKASKFVEQNVYDSKGNIAYTKVVAYSDNTPDAQRFLQRKATEQGMRPEQWGRVREDIRELRGGSDTDWDLITSGGRSAQRHRGKLLEDASGPQDLSTSPRLADPSEAATRASRSIAGRIAQRDYLEHTKARLLENHKEFFPKDTWGRARWTTADKLIPTDSATSKELANVRDMVEYLNYVEEGYINSADEMFKTVLNMAANIVGSFGLKNVEKGFRSVGEMQPASLVKNSAFLSYLGLNPARQLIIQPHQSVRLAAYNFPYWASGQLTTDVAKVISYKTMEAVRGREAARSAFGKVWTDSDFDIIDFIDRSGMLSSVDRHNLTRGPLVDIAESSHKGLRALGKTLAIPRKVGYDLGEQSNLVMHLLNVRDSYLRRGADLTDPAVREEAFGIARNLSWDMNRGGDFPYNQTWPSAILQFAQIPHKATAQYFSRKITGAEKLRLAAADLLLFGVPGGEKMAQIIGEDNLPQDKIARDMLIRGSEEVLLNAVFSSLADRDVELDFSALNPYNLDGWGNIVAAMIDGGIKDIVSQSPAANILWKDGSKTKEAVVTASRYLGGYFDPFEGHAPAELLDVADSIGRLSSGWDNFQKARMILKVGEAVDKHGNSLSKDVGFMEALGQAFGFPIREQSLYFEASTAIRDSAEEHRESVQKMYRQYQRVLLREEGLLSDNPDRAMKMLGIMSSIYSDDPDAMTLINGWILRDSVANDAKLMQAALSAGGLDDSGAIERALTDYFLRKGEDGEEFLRIFRDAKEARENFNMEID